MIEILLYSILIYIILYILYYVYLRIVNYYKSYKLLSNIPIIPSRYPFSHLVDLITNPSWEIMQEWAERYGSIIRMHFFSETFLIISEPKMIKYVLNNIKVYNKDKYTLAPFMCLLGTGIVSSEGMQWRKQRALITSVFRVSILEEGARTSFTAANRLADKLLKYKNTNNPVEMAEEFRKMTLQVIGATVLSLSPEECDRVFPSLYLPITVEANKRTFHPWRAYLPLSGSLLMNKCIKKLNSYITNIILERCKKYNENEPAMNDILDRIIAGVDIKDYGTPLKWHSTSSIVTQIRDQIKTFIFAGHETTSMMLTWSLYEISRRPDILEKVRNEAQSIFTKNDNDIQLPSFDALQKMTYIYNVLRETLRLYSVVPVVTREVIKDDQIYDYNIPKGTHIAILIKGVHHNESIWENPSEYNPDRFNDNDFDPYAFIPFINGPRNCVGQHFALLEARIALSVLLLKYSFKCTSKENGRKHNFNIPIEPIHKMQMHIN